MRAAASAAAGARRVPRRTSLQTATRPVRPTPASRTVGAVRAHRIADWPAYLALAAILVAGVALRVMTLHHGLPWTYHADEAFHFVTRAVSMFESGGLDPGYFENPTAYTYLVYTALRVTRGHGLPVARRAGDRPGLRGEPDGGVRDRAHPRRDPVHARRRGHVRRRPPPVGRRRRRGRRGGPRLRLPARSPTRASRSRTAACCCPSSRRCTARCGSTRTGGCAGSCSPASRSGSRWRSSTRPASPGVPLLVAAEPARAGGAARAGRLRRSPSAPAPWSSSSPTRTSSSTSATR